MIAIFYRFFEIATWTKGPEDIPKSRFLLLLCLFAYVSTALLGLLVARQLDTVVLLLSLDIGMTVFWLWGLLVFRGQTQRFVQTLTAFFGSIAITHLVLIPPVSTMTQFEAGTLPFEVSRFAFLITLIWQIMIHAHILHRALNLLRPIGVIMAVAFFVLTYGVGALVFPSTPVEVVA